jgi:hypothetical protein
VRIDQLSEKEKAELLALLEAERAHTFRREIMDELMDSYGIAMSPEERAAEHQREAETRRQRDAIRAESARAGTLIPEADCDPDQMKAFLRKWYPNEVVLDLWENTCVALTYLAALKGERCPSTHDYMALFPYPGAAKADELRGRLLEPKAGTRRQAHEFYYAYLKRAGFATFHSEIRIVMHRASAEVIAQRVAEMEVELVRVKAELAAMHVEPDSESSEGGEA